MATLREYFDSDFPYVINAAKPIEITLKDDQTSEFYKIEVQARMHLEFNSNTKYLSCYIPSCRYPLSLCIGILNNLSDFLSISDGVFVQQGIVEGESFKSTDLKFSGRVFFYSETPVPSEQFDELSKQASMNGLSIRYKGPDYAVRRSASEKPLAFISHDTRDKDEIAGPIAQGLTKLMCPVWYDEFSLKVGDRLRESIEKGLKESPKCILILSSNFLTNKGWTKVEFNSVFTREIIETQDIVLPIWCGVTKEQIYDYCPSLVNRVGLPWTLGVEEIIKRIYGVIRPEIPPPFAI